MKLCLFDLDNTLIDGDSDLLWSELLARDGALDVEPVRRWHVDYHRGTLDIEAFLAFQLAPLVREPEERLAAWRAEFLEEHVRPRIKARAREAVARHARLGHELVVITATNAWLAEPIARELSIPHLLATEPERAGGRATGRVAGVPCYREGKIAHLERWLAARGTTLGDVAESWFYTDSHNDVPLLLVVDHPVAVDPDERLAERARREGWPVERWR